MNLIERIFAEPELLEQPPVLVDVGAAGGVNPVWRRIARHAIGVGFEPDEREVAALSDAHRAFRRWIFCPTLAAPACPPAGQQPFYLTQAPQCSSLLLPDQAGLGEWVFADQFDVIRRAVLPATSLVFALEQSGLDRIDWLKCDTQGMDLKLYQSLPPVWRERLLVAEFEPGLIDAYRGEDQVADVLSVMKREPFWLAKLEVGRTPRGRRDLMAAGWADLMRPWIRRLAPTAPAWAGLQFQREISQLPGLSDRRSWLLAWVFAVISGQPGQGLTIAEEGCRRFADGLFAEMASDSRQRVRWAMLRNFPSWTWQRLWRQR